jgi:hypothetical protein
MVKSASVSAHSERSAPSRFELENLVPLRLDPLKVEPVRVASSNSAELSAAAEKSAPVTSDPRKRVPERSASLKDEWLRLDSDTWIPARFAPVKSPAGRLHLSRVH